MAAVVVGDAVWKPRSHIRYAELLHQKLAKLKRPRSQIQSGGFVGRVFQELWIKNPHHCHTGATGAHDYLGTVEHTDGTDGYLAGLIPVAGIETGLAAAGLTGSKLAGVTKSLENLRNGHAHLWGHLIDKAGNEKADFHAAVV